MKRIPSEKKAPKIPPSTCISSIGQGRVILLLFLPLISFAQVWRFANGPYGGEIDGIVVHPLQPSIVYAVGPGLYKSTNGGASWCDITPPGSNIGIEPVVDVDPQDPNTVYLGGEWGGVLRKSSDGGASWETKFLMKDSLRSKIGTIAVNPQNPDEIYLGMIRELNKMLFKSTDKGETWLLLTNGLPQHANDSSEGAQSVRSIEFNPFNTSTVFAEISLEGLFRSDDAGATWRYLQFDGMIINDIEVLPWDTSIVLVGTRFGIFKSTNGGATWQQTANYMVNTVTSDSTSRIVYFGAHLGDGVFRSNDDGNTWHAMNSPELPISRSMATWVLDIAIGQPEPGIVYLGSAVGPYKSNDGGESWRQIFEGILSFYAYAFQVAPSDANIAYAVGLNGIYRTTNQGVSWRYIGGLGTFNLVAIDPIDPNIVFASQVGLDLMTRWYRTINGGRIWDISIIDVGGVTFAPFVRIDTSPERAVYISGSRFLRSLDHGTTWEELNAPIVPRSLVIAERNPQHLYISRGDRIYKSTDRGETWDSLQPPITGREIYLCGTPESLEIIYASVLDSGLYKSTNAGQTWEAKNSGINRAGHHGLMINSKNPKEMFTKDFSGIYRSENGGDSWKFFLPHPTFASNGYYSITLDTSGSGRFLIGSIDFAGIYLYDLELTSVDHSPSDLPRTLYLSQNYPNPFNPSTRIEYLLTEATIVRLEIFDILGGKIKTLVSEKQGGGVRRVNWDGKDEFGRPVTSGVYFYKLTVGNSSVSKKMLLIR